MVSLCYPKSYYFTKQPDLQDKLQLFLGSQLFSPTSSAARFERSIFSHSTSLCHESSTQTLQSSLMSCAGAFMHPLHPSWNPLFKILPAPNDQSQQSIPRASSTIPTTHLPDRRAIKNHCRNTQMCSILTNYNLWELSTEREGWPDPENENSIRNNSLASDVMRPRDDENMVWTDSQDYGADEIL